MLRKLTLMVMTLALSMLVVAPAALAAPPEGASGAPDFGPHIVVDGEEFGTKAVTALPAPNDNNEQSFDDLYVVTNGVDEQLLVAEYAPGDTEYNGGRWATITVTWDDPADAVLLTSDDQIHMYEDMGLLTVTHGTFEGGPPAYFECPLLPVLHS